MKDFAQIKVTLSVLDEVQKDLLSKKETAVNWYNDYLSEFQDYRKTTNEDGDTAYFRKDKDGGEIDCSKWDYNYAKERVESEERAIKSYDALLTYLDGFKI